MKSGRSLLVFSEKNGSVISHSDVELREVSTTPSFLLFPLDSTRISHSKYTQQRNHEILVQRVPNEPDVLVPHPLKKPGRVNPTQPAPIGDPSPRIDDTHVFSPVL